MFTVVPFRDMVNKNFLPSGTKKIILSGQHSFKAMLILREEDLAAGRALRAWQQKVRAKVLRHDTPVHLRQLAAGDSQYKQRSYEDLKLSDWGRLLLGPEVKKEGDFDKRMALAIRKCGFERPENMVCTPPPLPTPWPVVCSESADGEVEPHWEILRGHWG